MCNLYSITKNQTAIREFTNAMRDLTGNLPAQPGGYPDYMAPIARSGADVIAEIAMDLLPPNRSSRRLVWPTSQGLPRSQGARSPLAKICIFAGPVQSRGDSGLSSIEYLFISD